jgi:uncharacterized SAM-binding protein YcdF (DUF218 family)
MAFQFLQSVPIFSRRRYDRRQTYWMLAIVTLLIVLLSYIPLRLALASVQFPQPQAILTLGGRPAREAFTAEFAQTHPELMIWISSGMNPAKAQPFFAMAGVDLKRVTFDFRATDTVTNFTTLVDEFDRRQIHHVYLITSDFHMARARAIAAIVFGSRGIITTPVIVPSRTQPESNLHILRDVGRSIVWLLTQRTGASLRSQSWAEPFK